MDACNAPVYGLERGIGAGFGQLDSKLGFDDGPPYCWDSAQGAEPPGGLLNS